MQLSISDRLHLLDILPSVGDVTTLLVVRDAQEVLGFTAEEVERLKFTRDEDRVYWDEKADGQETDIALTKPAIDVVINRLRETSERKQLRIELLPLYERFLGLPETPEAPNQE